MRVWNQRLLIWQIATVNFPINQNTGVAAIENVVIQKNFKFMQQIIYTTKYYCELCKKELIVNLYGEHDSNFTADDEPELIEWARHFHWIDNHRVCALCGRLVVSEELDLAENDGSIQIHEDYTDHYEKVNPKEKFRQLLTVHVACIKECIDKTSN